MQYVILENLKDSADKLLELTSEFSKVAGFKVIFLQKAVVSISANRKGSFKKYYLKLCVLI